MRVCRTCSVFFFCGKKRREKILCVSLEPVVYFCFNCGRNFFAHSFKNLAGLGVLTVFFWEFRDPHPARTFGWRMHCGAKVTESSTNKQHHPHLHVAAPFARAGCNAVCPAVRKRGQRADTIRSCSLVAPEWPVHVTVWSP